MLTPEQEKWIAHLSDKDNINISQFDPTAEETFQNVKARIQDALGEDIPIEHHGATSLGISGQDEIDVYMPVSPERFTPLIPALKQLFGEPRSMYEQERIRFSVGEDGKHIDVFLVNQEHDGWKNLVRFEGYLKSHPEALKAYKLLKEEGHGLSIREYYRRKNEFINQILEKANLNEASLDTQL